MRIDSFAQITSMYNLGKNNKQVKNESSKSFSDQLQISSVGKDIQTAKKAVDGVPDVRTDIVTDLKAKIDAGTYNVDSDSFAEKLFGKYNRAL